MKETKTNSGKNILGQVASNIGVPILAIVVGLLFGAIFMVLIGKNPGEAYKALWVSSFGSMSSFAETLVNTTPLIFTGLSVAFAFRCGLLNMGGEGQFLAAYVVAGWIGAFFHMPAWIHIPFTFAAAALAGALWAIIPGILKARLGIHEVISTIMFNYIALQGSTIVIREFLMPKGGYIPASPMIQPTAQLPRLIEMTRFNASFFVALALAAFIGWLLWRTVTGYEIRAVGLNPHAAEYGGVNVAKNIILAMMISGALAGFAGATQVMGLEYRAYQPFGLLGYGFTGIAVALLGKNHPAGIILGALLFGVLQRGANSMQSLAGVPKEVISIIQACIIFFVASDYALKKIHRRFKAKKGVA